MAVTREALVEYLTAEIVAMPMDELVALASVIEGPRNIQQAKDDLKESIEEFRRIYHA
jgi:hypothetical protein